MKKKYISLVLILGFAVAVYAGDFDQLMKFYAGLATDTITELTTDAGVTIEGTQFENSYIQLGTSPGTPTYSEGLFYWDSTNKTIAVYVEEPDVSMQVGQEIWVRVYNDTGVTIDNGKVCYLSGVSSGFPTIALARSDDPATCLSTLGFATHSIENGTYGYITRIGTVRDVDTSGCSAGDVIWLSSTTAGTYTSIQPASPFYSISLGNCAVSHASTGTIEVQVNIGGNTRSTLKFYNGTILEDPELSITSNGTIVTASLQKSGGGDLNLVFDSDFTLLDCTPAVTASLTPGTDSVPVLNYLFIKESAPTVIQVNTTGYINTEQIIALGTVVCQSATGVQTDGVYKQHNWTDHFANSVDQGHLFGINKWIRYQNATWLTGSQITPTLGAAQYDVSTGSGTMMQLHEHTTDAFNTATGSDVFVVNNNATPYVKVGDLTGQTSDSTGTSLNNKYFSFVFWISGNQGTGNDKLYCNLPSGSYNTEAGSIADSSNYTNYNIPADFKGTGILIARVVSKVSSTTWTHYQTDDLRGLIPAQSAGSGGSTTDADAVHVNVASEISALSTVTAASGDFILIEDVSDSNNKKNVLASDFLAGAGDVSKVGTPVDNQVGVWTGDGTIEGTTGLTYDGSNLFLTGDIGATGTRITKGWFTDFQVTNAIAGSITGNAGTVTTITGLAPDTATTQATQASITTCANLVTVGTIGTGVWQGTAIDGAYIDIEGTEIKSTGEAGGTKFLREDGDGTCSWQAAGGGGGGLTGVTDKTANYTVQTSDADAQIRATFATSADFTLTMYTLSGNTGNSHYFRNESDYTVTLAFASETADAVEAGTTSTVINATAHTASAGQVLEMTSGDESGEIRRITSTATNTITISPALTGAPSATETFQVHDAVMNKKELQLGSGESINIYGSSTNWVRF